MLFSDTYKEIVQPGEANLRERGSKFIAYAFPVHSDEEIRHALQSLKSRYPDATHHCYAWILNPDQSAQRANDDGEPSNSAGKPILRAILSFGLTNILVVVVRYFGGTQLGIPGLIEAYGQATKLVLSACKTVELFIQLSYVVSTDFAHEQEIHRLIRTFDATVISNEYTDKVSYTVSVRKSKAVEFEEKATENYLLDLKKI